MQISQAKSILLQQQSEWSRILGENEERQSYIKYGIILTVVSHLATFIGSAFLANSLFGAFSFGISYFAALEAVQLVLAIATLYFIPQILGTLAPSFGGQNNSMNATKLYVFTMTPVWIGSMLGIIPVIGWLGMIAGGIYGIMLFWQHVSEAMSVPEDKKAVYVIVSIVVIGVLMAVISWIATSIATAMFVPSVLGRHLF